MKKLPTNKMNKMPKLLVVDDDPIFRALIAHAAKTRRIPLTVMSSLGPLERLERPGGFDVVIVDYFLDNTSGNTKGTEIALITPSTPTILMSSNLGGVEDNDSWPTSIRKFINKKAGVDTILDTAVILYQNRFEVSE